jgi:alcohol dehydrogenase class IV
MLVCGTHAMRAQGYLDDATQTLRDAKVDLVVYDAISGEPTLELIRQGLDLARHKEIDVMIGLGGGSAMDAAKAIAGLYTHKEDIKAYFGGERQVSGGGIPWVAVPTTAGTGAEVTKNAVLMSEQHARKASLRHDDWYAAIALVDPELTLQLPSGATASSGGDALTQAIEAYTSIGASPVTDALATDAIARIGRSLLCVYRKGDDLAARTDMLYGSLLAGMAFSNARLGAVHGMAHPLGYHYHIPHGVVCGLLLPHTMSYNLEYALAKYAHIAELLGHNTRQMDEHQAAKMAAQRVKELIADLDIPSSLSEFGVQEADLAEIAQQSMPSGSLKHNPRPLQTHDVIAILRAAL